MEGSERGARTAMYSERLLELFRNAAHGGGLEGATHQGEAGTPGHGPYIRLWLRVEDGVVREARFKTYGCPACIACAEALCALVEGRQVSQVGEITPEVIAEAVGGVPEEKSHCPQLAVQAWGRVRAL